MFKYFKIILMTLAIAASAPLLPAFAEPVGKIEGNKSSWYAIIGSGNKGRKLYVKGDIFYSGKDPAKGLRISDIKNDALVLEDMVSRDSLIIKTGEHIPVEGRTLVFEKTVESNVLEYNYNKKPSAESRKNQLEDFTVKNLEKKKIILEKNYNSNIGGADSLSAREKEVFQSPQDKDSGKKIILKELFDKIETRKVGEDIWAVDKGSARSAVYNAGAALISAIKSVEPGYRFGEGPSLKFNTDIAAVTVNKDGFTIRNIAVARLTKDFGIREGDIIKSINGYPVSNLLGIYRAYENTVLSKDTKLLSIDIVRAGKKRTLIYKIR